MHYANKYELFGRQTQHIIYD